MKLTSIYHIHDVNDRDNTSVDYMLNYCHEVGITKMFFVEHYPWGIPSSFFDRRIDTDTVIEWKHKLLTKSKKYGIEIKVGAEIEFPKTNRKFFSDVQYNPVFDYAILGNHFYYTDFLDKDINVPWDQIMTAMIKNDEEFVKPDYRITPKLLDMYYENIEAAFKSGVITYFAHPDKWTNRYQTQDKHFFNLVNRLINLCVKYKMPIGFNIGRFSRSNWNEMVCPNRTFWTAVSKTDLQVLLEADAHTMSGLDIKLFDKAMVIAKKWGFYKNIVNDITVNYFDHSVSFKPIKVVDLKAIAIKEKKFFDYGNDYSYAQLKALHDDVNTKIVGGYNRDNKIISYVIYTVSDKIDILKLFVDKTYRRRGIAGKMIDIVKETNRNIIVEVSAKNTTAIKFYLKNKFKQISIRKSYYGTHDALILEFENKKPAVS